jgi:autotransporter-associated beta strand protein
MLHYTNSTRRELNGSGTLTFQKSTGNALYETGTKSLDLDMASLVLGSTTEFRINTPSEVYIHAAVSGGGGLDKTGAEALHLVNSSNSYGGSTNIQQGTLYLDASEVIPNSSAATVASSATLALMNTNETIGSLAGDGTVSLGSGSLTTGGDNSSTSFSGGITGTGSLTKTGAGAMTLSGSSSYSGATTVSGGTLSGNTIADAGSNSAFGAGNSFTISNAATLQYTGPTNSTNRSLSLGNGGVIDVTDAAATFSLNNDVTGSGGLTKTGHLGAFRKQLLRRSYDDHGWHLAIHLDNSHIREL